MESIEGNLSINDKIVNDTAINIVNDFHKRCKCKCKDKDELSS